MDTPTSEEFSLKKVIPMVLTVATGMLLVMMDTTIMNIALPTLQHHFSTNLATAQWCITAYTFALAAVTPLSGWLSDRITAKRAFAGAIVLFTIFSFQVHNSMVSWYCWRGFKPQARRKPVKCTVYFQNLTTGVCCAQNVTYSTPTRAKLFFLLKLSRYGELEKGDCYKARRAWVVTAHQWGTLRGS